MFLIHLTIRNSLFSLNAGFAVFFYAAFYKERPEAKLLSSLLIIDQFRYIKIQSKTIDISTRLVGITTECS